MSEQPLCTDGICSVSTPYDRIAPVYDLIEGIVEGRRLRTLRADLWRRAQGPRILEVGIGTGRNLPLYPPFSQVTAIDVSTGMLRRATIRAQHLRQVVDLRQMNVERLDFPDATFDTVVASLVFCSVANPVRGFSEVFRVCKPGGRLLVLEHGAGSNRVITKLLNVLEWVVGRTGEHINRRPEETIQLVGFQLDIMLRSSWGVIRLIEAHKPMA